jgi:hypothetical protein
VVMTTVRPRTATSRSRSSNSAAASTPARYKAHPAAALPIAGWFAHCQPLHHASVERTISRARRCRATWAAGHPRALAVAPGRSYNRAKTSFAAACHTAGVMAHHAQLPAHGLARQVIRHAHHARRRRASRDAQVACRAVRPSRRKPPRATSKSSLRMIDAKGLDQRLHFDRFAFGPGGPLTSPYPSSSSGRRFANSARCSWYVHRPATPGVGRPLTIAASSAVCRPRRRVHCRPRSRVCWPAPDSVQTARCRHHTPASARSPPAQTATGSKLLSHPHRRRVREADSSIGVGSRSVKLSRSPAPTAAVSSCDLTR